MVSASTRLALQRRAVRTAKFLDKWADQLWAEMKAQNVPMYTWGKDGKPDDSPLMTLKRINVRTLREGMKRQAEELRKFSDWK